jgi:phosphoribosyl 1,2-cyclic phosphodiesterase
MLVKFCPLFSGSNGNSIFISYKNTKILIDCGCSFKRIKESLSKIDEDIFALDAVFLTHSHNDHTSALPMILKNLDNCYVVGSMGTLVQLGLGNSEYKNKICTTEIDKEYSVRDFDMSAFFVPHDANETVGYNIKAGNRSISLLTDVGHLEESLFTNVIGKDLVFLEANHDVHTLENCSYPHHLKQRILSDFGHLSNENAGKFASELIKNGTSRIMLGHLSGEANTTELALNSVKSVFNSQNIKVDKDVKLGVSPRGELGEVINL